MGPTASVIVPRPAYEEQVRALIRASFAVEAIDLVDTTFDGWIETRPFVIDCGWEYKREIEDIDFDSLCRTWGWPPVDSIGVAAMCNDDADHALLARVCIALAQRFGGIVVLGGRPWSLSDEVRAGLPGRLSCLPTMESGQCRAGSSEECYCDAEFLTAWMAHPAFRMVK